MKLIEVMVDEYAQQLLEFRHGHRRIESFMRRAKALVTDHGGMMSHAAIVARELNKQCIVGTRQATKLLKTGDKVTLGPVNGTVTKQAVL